MFKVVVILLNSLAPLSTVLYCISGPLKTMNREYKIDGCVAERVKIIFV